MKYRCDFFIQGEFLGTSLVEGEDRRGASRPPWSIAYFCPACGEVWARIHFEGQRFYTCTRLCDKHASEMRIEVPGSIWVPFEPAIMRELPEAVLRRELQTHLKHEEIYKCEEVWE